MNRTSTRARRTRAIIRLAAFVCLAGCAELYAPNIRPQQPNVASLNPADWYIMHSDNMPYHPSGESSGAWSFAFPTNGRIDYVQTPFRATAMPHNVSITFKAESDMPQYKVIDLADRLPATVHLFFEIENDDGSNANGQWWATYSSYDFESADNNLIRFVVPLTPDQWSNVVGQYDATSFYDALSNIGWIGITFGGQSFFGHGVALTGGSAKYILVDFSVD